MKYGLIIVTLLSLVSYLDRYVVAALAPKLQVSLGLSNLQLGFVMSAFVIGFLIVEPLFSYVAEKVGRLRLIALGAFTASLATCATGMLQTVELLLAARIAVGVGQAASFNAAPGYLGQALYAERRATKTLLFTYSAWPIAVAFGYFIGGLAADYYDWTIAFFIAAIPGFFVSILTLTIPSELDQSKGFHRRTLTELFSMAREHFLNRFYTKVLVGYLFYGFAVAGFSYWATKFGVDVLGVTLTKISLGVGLVTLVAATLGAWIGSEFGDIFVGREFNIAGFCTFASLAALSGFPFALALVWAQDLLSFLSHLFICELLFFSLAVPINTAILASVKPSHAVSATILSMLLMQICGDLIAPVFLGFLMDYVSLRRAFSILPAALLIAGAIWWRTGKQAFALTQEVHQPYPMWPFLHGCARFVQWIFKYSARIFFRELTVLRSDEDSAQATKVKAFSEETPTLFIANHPNSLVDGLVIYCTIDRLPRVIAKSTLWNHLMLRPILAVAGAVPVRRAQDADEIKKGLHHSATRVSSNEEVFEIVSRLMRSHSFIIYPEGITHDGTQMMSFKSGAARMLLAAASSAGGEQNNQWKNVRDDIQVHTAIYGASVFQPPALEPEDYSFQPVGIYFDNKSKFRSRALVHYGRRRTLREILDLSELALFRKDPQNPALITKVTRLMEQGLRELLPEAHDANHLSYLQSLALLMSEPFQDQQIGERYRWEVIMKRVLLLVEQKWSPEQRALVQKSVEDYFERLKKIPDHKVRDFSFNRRRYIRRSIARFLLFCVETILLLPFTILGFLLYYGLYVLVGRIARRLAADRTELSTYKFLAGWVIHPAGTLIYATIIGGYLAGKINLSIGIVGGFAIPIFSAFCALRFSERLSDAIEGIRVLFSLNYRDTFDALAEERTRVVNTLLKNYSDLVTGL